MAGELAGMKATPSKGGSLVVGGWYWWWSSRPDSPDRPCGLVIFVLTHSTMPARGDYYWRKSDSHPVGDAADRDRRYHRDIRADRNQKNLFFLTERSV